jgi:hypothetical protein
MKTERTMAVRDLDRYDRQIRAWGFETQRRLQSSRFFFLGINSTSLECMKNLVLAGALSVHCVLDPVLTEDPELHRQFEYLHGLNPRCQWVDLAPAEFSPPISPDQLIDYDVICLFGLTTDLVAPLLANLPQKTYLIGNRLSGDLIAGVSEHYFVSDPAPFSPLEGALVGSLLSQMIVDYLPPLESPVAVRLQFDPATLSSRVDRLPL